MGLIYHDHKVIREIVQQSLGCIPRLQSIQMHGIILNTGTKSRLTQHFHIKMGSLCDPLCFDQFILTFKIFDPFLQFRFDPLYGTLHLVRSHHIMRCRENHHMLQIGQRFSGQNIHFLYSVHFISKKFHPDRSVRSRRREDLYHISTNPECTAMEIHIISCILNFDETADHFISVSFHARPQ